MSTQANIIQKLTEALQPEHLQVINESHMHNVPPGSESHFKVVVSSAEFQSMTRVRRHQRMYNLLAAELQTGVHALALHTYTPEEWQQINSAPVSPPCLGGSKARA